MIGFLGGAGFSCGLVGAVWSHHFISPGEGLLNPYLATVFILVLGALLGVIFFPRTVGIFSMFAMLGSAVAFLVALIRDIRLAPIMILWALAFLAVQQIIAGVRKRGAT